MKFRLFLTGHVPSKVFLRPGEARSLCARWSPVFFGNNVLSYNVQSCHYLTPEPSQQPSVAFLVDGGRGAFRCFEGKGSDETDGGHNISLRHCETVQRAL